MATCCEGWTPTHVTRSLLGWGAVVAVPSTSSSRWRQAVTRPGFDLTRHEWSLLENGDLGWVQVGNFVLTGADAARLRGRSAARAGGRVGRVADGLRCSPASSAPVSWLPGILRADPALGFPVGTPEGVGTVTAHGIGHFAAAGVGFVAVAAACFVLARRFTAEGGRRLAHFSRVTGVVFIAGFLCVASGAGSVAANLLFTGAVVLVFTWLAVVAVHLYRSLADRPAPTRS